MNNLDSITWVVVDTTARAHIRTKGDVKPTKDMLNEAMKSLRVSVRQIRELTMTQPGEKIDITIKGLA